jgi:hypothetical protein
MRKVFSALFLQSTTAKLLRAETFVIPEYDFLDFWRTADVLAYQCRHSLKQDGLRANRFIHNYEIVREAARFYEGWINDGTEDLGDCFCILPESPPLEFDEKASPKTNIDALNHKLDCWIQESSNKFNKKTIFYFKNNNSNLLNESVEHKYS